MVHEKVFDAATNATSDQAVDVQVKLNSILNIAPELKTNPQ